MHKLGFKICHYEKTQLFLVIKNEPQLGTQNGPHLKDLVNTKHECEVSNSRLTATAKSRHFSKANSVTMPPDFKSAKIDTENEQNTSVRTIF